MSCTARSRFRSKFFAKTHLVHKFVAEAYRFRHSYFRTYFGCAQSVLRRPMEDLTCNG